MGALQSRELFAASSCGDAARVRRVCVRSRGRVEAPVQLSAAVLETAHGAFGRTPLLAACAGQVRWDGSHCALSYDCIHSIFGMTCVT